MKIALALRSLIGIVAKGVGLEGLFLLAGTALLAVGASFVSPAGPWLVTGAVALIAGIALAIPTRRT